MFDFINPTVGDPVPADERNDRYRPFAWHEFMSARAYGNFADLGVDDTQVTDYRISNQ